MSYTVIRPPPVLDFHQMSKAQAREYAQWFHAILPERVAQLADVVRQTPGFDTWERNRSPESLESLGQWFAPQVTVVDRSAEELAKEHSKLAFPLPVSATRLSNHTLSICMDVGMYLAQVVLRNVAGTAWSQDLRKSSIDYAQPVIAGFGKVHMNPVHLVLVKGSKAAGGKLDDAAALRQLYEIWAGMATTSGIRE